MYITVEGEKLYTYYKSFEKDIRQSLKKARKTASEKDIHTLRVSIKKLKGIYKLIDLCVEDFIAEEKLAPILDLYKPAGRIRENQVNLKRLNEIEPVNTHLRSYHTYVYKLIKKHRKKFKDKAQTFSLKRLKLTGEQIKSCCQSFTQETIITHSFHFVEERKQVIMSLLGNINDEESIHNIRKKIKEVSAVLGLLDTILDDNILQTNTPQKLKVYEDSMGLWHDRLILRQSLESFISKKPNLQQSVQSDINLIISKLEQKEIAFLKGINQLVEDVFELFPKSTC